MVTYLSKNCNKYMITTLFTNPLFFVINLIALVVAITIHEFAHAITADKLGDPTPRIQKRVTLNPLSHLDMYGTLFLLLFGFGWGKPVEFDWFNIKNPRRDAALISIAGPASNFLLALICSLLIRLFLIINNPMLVIIGQLLLVPIISLNLILGVFNLIPIHPLDGFKIVSGLLNREQAVEWDKLSRYGFIFLLFLIIPFGSKSMLSTILDPILSFLHILFIPQPLFS